MALPGRDYLIKLPNPGLPRLFNHNCRLLGQRSRQLVMLRYDTHWDYSKRCLLRLTESDSPQRHYSSLFLVAFTLARHGTKLRCQDVDFDLRGIYYMLHDTHGIRLGDSAKQKLFQHFHGRQFSNLVGLCAYLLNVLLPLQELKIDGQKQIAPHDRLADVNRK